VRFTNCAGCAFIKYSQRDQAQAAINALNGVYVMQVRCLCYKVVAGTLLMYTSVVC
jgi:RNA recognition motif-containing protein